MNRAFVKRWIGALRSGKYQQCRNGCFSDPIVLLDSPEYNSLCCLGVANVLLKNESGDCTELSELVPELNSISLPTMARNEAIVGGDQTRMWCHLTAMNDGEGIYRGDSRNFSQIADFLEEKLLA